MSNETRAGLSIPPEEPTMQVVVKFDNHEFYFSGRPDGYPNKAMTPLQRRVAKALLRGAIEELDQA